MGMRKKIVSLLLCTALGMSLAAGGCSGGENDSQGAGKDSQDTESSENADGDEADRSGVYGEAGAVSEFDAANSNYTLTVDASNEVHEISDLLYGIFIEDINFAADGGLYAEMVQNRSFEFTQLAAGNQKHAWSDVGTVSAEVTIADAENGLNINNTNYMVITNESAEKAGIANRGFLEGMAVQEGAAYRFSIYAKGLDGYTGPVYVDLMAGEESAASAAIESITSEWAKYELTLNSTKTASSNVKLQVTIDSGKAAVDMVSLFPENTYKGRENGLRVDLAEKLEALEPAFLRFPGGCVVEGATIETRYNWKDSIGVDENGEPLEFNGAYGDVAGRKMGQNIWTDERAANDQFPSFMSYGLGFYEYFLLAEDLGAIGVPVVNCGLCCMGQSDGSGPSVGSDEAQQYIQDALDLVEFCRGDASTKWGAVRIAMGHEEPFALKYIGIGNEQWGTNFYLHYEEFVKAFAEARKENPDMYGDIELMFTAGVDDGDSGAGQHSEAYSEAANFLEDNSEYTVTDFAGAIDHHYYNDPDWFLSHTDYYDETNYSRTEFSGTLYHGGIPVFLGEYAARSNTLNAALAEAAYMTGLERNGDIVVMAAYAPLFGNLTAMHWAPDLIWFNNVVSTPSINYFVQQIFAKNAGTTLLDSTLEGAEMKSDKAALAGKVGVGTWSTSAAFDNLKIVNTESGEELGSQDFESDTLSEWEMVSDGDWSIEDGKLVQASTVTDTAAYSTTGTAAYFGDVNWSDYTYTLEATKIGGDEGFLIPFSVGDKNNNFFWNIGGWGNTVSCLQQVKNGTKSDQVPGTAKNCVLETGKAYQLKIEVSENHVNCYIDDKLYVDYDLVETTSYEAYHVVSMDDSGDIIIKMVNITDSVKTFAIDLQNAEITSDTAEVDVVAGNDLANDNILGKDPVVTLESSTVSGVKNQFNYTVPQYSVTVLRIKTK